MEKKLTRDISNKMFAGVAAGIAKYFQLDVTWVRIAFALAAFFGGGGLWIYLILWIAVPEDKYSAFTYTDYKVNNDPLKTTFDSFKSSNDSSKVNPYIGIGMIALGTYFLLRQFDIIPDWFEIHKLWPLSIVFIGIAILMKRKKEIETVKYEEPIKQEEEVVEVEEVKVDTSTVDNGATSAQTNENKDTDKF